MVFRFAGLGSKAGWNINEAEKVVAANPLLESAIKLIVILLAHVSLDRVENTMPIN